MGMSIKQTFAVPEPHLIPDVVLCDASNPAIQMQMDLSSLAEGVHTVGLILGDGASLEIYRGAGAPVDYTDGDPPATGEGVAAPCSLYIDTDGKAIYMNTGTQAQPTWSQLAFAV